MFVGCKSTKGLQRQISSGKPPVETAGKCEQKIKYFIEKMKDIRNGEEVSANTEIVIDPAEKLIRLTSEPPDQKKVNFDTEIESVDCNLNANLTEGQSTYRGYIKQSDGTKTYTILKVEAKDGALTITGGDAAQPDRVVMIVTKWEVVIE
jgi:hypothetical protein